MKEEEHADKYAPSVLRNERTRQPNRFKEEECQTRGKTGTGVPG